MVLSNTWARKEAERYTMNTSGSYSILSQAI